jgi:F0F1-type ATP synthase assembly protein I
MLAEASFASGLNVGRQVGTLRAARPGGAVALRVADLGMGPSEHGMPAKQKQSGDAGRAYALGFELVCAVAGFVLVGVWIDRHYSSGPWGTLICLALGLIGGTYNLLRGIARLSGDTASAVDRSAPRAPDSGGSGDLPR